MKSGSNRSFGILFFIVFMFVSLWPILYGGPLRIWSIPVSIVFLILGLINSKFLTPLNILWLKLGELLGRIVAPLVMAAIYFVIVTPIGLFMRLVGKDLLNTKFSKDKSYWIKREKNVGSMKRQF